MVKAVISTVWFVAAHRRLDRGGWIRGKTGRALRGAGRHDEHGTGPARPGGGAGLARCAQTAGTPAAGQRRSMIF